MQKGTSIYYLLILAASHGFFIILDYCYPPRPSFYLGFQLRSMDMIYFWITCSTSIQVGYDDDDSPNNLSLIYCALGCLFWVFIVYFYEKRRCLSFLSVNFGRLNLDNSINKYLFSMLVLIERASQDYYKDLLFQALKGLLGQAKLVEDLNSLQPGIEDILKSSNSSRRG